MSDNGSKNVGSILGIHHVTAMAGDAQRNVDFYTGVLGLRLVKQTVNFDDPGTYHLYYGDGLGRPGTILTFFPWPGGFKGRTGLGQVTETLLAVPAGSLPYWHGRLSEARALVTGGEGDTVRFTDPDGMRFRLVEEDGPGEGYGPVLGEYAIKRIQSVELGSAKPEATTALVRDTLGVADAATLSPDLATLGRGAMGPGAVHHVAFRVADDETQLAWQKRLSDLGFHVTPVQDRNYFHSIYFREPGGVLFEIATDPPGFAADEPAETLGESLKLPEWLEPHRATIEAALPPLRVPVPARV